VRCRLTCLILQTSSVATLVLLVPLLVFVSQQASDRALDGARLQASAMVPALAITTDRGALAEAAARAEASGAGRLSVYPPAGNPVGAPRTRPEDVRDVVSSLRSVTRDVPGGVVYLQPVQLRAGAVAVVEVFMPEAELSRGVHAVWLVLAVVALALVLGSVAVGDRLGLRIVQTIRCLTAAVRQFGKADLAVRVKPTGPPELMELGRSFNVMADRMVGLLQAEH
jgi:methyl-accepting chemotaxis protein